MAHFRYQNWLIHMEQTHLQQLIWEAHEEIQQKLLWHRSKCASLHRSVIQAIRACKHLQNALTL